RAVEVEVIVLDILAVVGLGVGESEDALLQDRVAAVPEGESEAEPLLLVADPSQSVLTPVVSARARVVVGEVIPGAAVGAVVLADGAPLALAQIRPPLLPGRAVLIRRLEPRRF